jgi:hypothetical protein
LARSIQLEDATWPDARRPEAWAGELRVNLIRLVAIVLFYGRHLVDFYLASPGSPVRGAYHARVTIVVVAWAAAAILLHVTLSRRRVAESLPYFTVLLDLLMVTVLVALAGRPRGPLVLLYFPIIVSAPLRLSLPVVYTATAGAIAGYLFSLGYYAWHVVGFDVYYATPELRVPRGDEAMVVLSLLVTGLFAGQAVRQVVRIVAGPRVTVAADPAPAQTLREEA